MGELVSVIMPTSDSRSSLAELAIKCFNSQTWSDKELIIVKDNGTIGEKLNIACERAKGNILVRWDDDDWSSPDRITEQVKLLQKVDVTGYNAIYFWDSINRIASWYRGSKNYCLGTSLCFTREYWKNNPFPLVNNGEDLTFQERARTDKRLLSIPADQRMVARIHGSNTCSGRIKYPPVLISKLPEQFFKDLGGI